MDAGRLKELEDENQMYSEEYLKSEIIQEAMAQYAVILHGVSIRQACRIFLVSENVFLLVLSVFTQCKRLRLELQKSLPHLFEYADKT